tara:strand:+ start:408 stop:3836 length:3429 start_codon:yes stop_codon:yes gene_type:complete
MSLMEFLSSPLGSIVGGAAEKASDVYWNVTRPEAKEAEKSFVQLIKNQKAKYNAAISSGTATRSALKAGANTLKNTVPEFKNHSIEDLISTIQAVKTARNVNSGEAIKYLIDERGKGFTVTEPVTSDKKEASDVSTQTTSMLTGGGGVTPKAPVKENRGVLTRMLVGESQYTIQDRALKSMGMTREEFNALSSPPVMKRLNMGEPVIKFAIKAEVDPMIVNLNEKILKENNETAVDLGTTTPTSILVPGTEDGSVLTVGKAQRMLVNILAAESRGEEVPEDDWELAGKIQSEFNSMAMDKIGFKELGEDVALDKEIAMKIIKTPGYHQNTKIEMQGHYNTLVALEKQMKIAKPEQYATITNKINEVSQEIKFLGKDSIVKISPMVVDQYKDVQRMVKEKVVSLNQRAFNSDLDVNELHLESKKIYSQLNNNLTTLLPAEKLRLEQKLNEMLAKIQATSTVEVDTNLETAYSTVYNALIENKIDSSVRIQLPGAPPGTDMSVDDYFEKFVRKPFNDIRDNGDNTEGESKTGALMAALKLMHEKIPDSSTSDQLKTLSDWNDFKNAGTQNTTYNAISSKISNTDNNLTPTQRVLGNATLRAIDAFDIKVQSFIANAKELKPEEIAKYFTQVQNERSQLIGNLRDVVTFRNEMYHQNIDSLRIQVKNAENALKTRPMSFDQDQTNNALKLISEFKTLAAIPLVLRKVNDDGEELKSALTGSEGEAETQRIREQDLKTRKEENTKAIHEVVTKLDMLTRATYKEEESALQEKINLVLAAEKEKYRMANLGADMPKDMSDKYEILIGGLIAQGNIITTKDGSFLRDFRFSTNDNGELQGDIYLSEVQSFTPAGGEITMSSDQIEENDKQIKRSLSGEKTVGNILKTFIEHPNAFNFIGSIQLFGSDVVDLMSWMGMENKSLFGTSKDDIQAMEKARNQGIELLGTAKDILFDDPRLSDQDLAIVRRYIKVLENSSLLGTTRGQAALAVIQAAMTKDAMLRAHDADFDAVTPISVPRVEPDNPDDSTTWTMVQFIEKNLGFSLTSGKNTLAEQAFIRTLKSYGIDKLPTKESMSRLSKEEQHIVKYKIKLATEQMQWVMSDIYHYSLKGKSGRGTLASQFLIDHQYALVSREELDQIEQSSSYEDTAL